LYPEIANHQLSTLGDYLLKAAFDARNATADVDVLRRLCDCRKLKDIHAFTSTVDAVMKSLVRDDAAYDNLPSLSILIDKNNG
jgi:hypothetical protein